MKVLHTHLTAPSAGPLAWAITALSWCLLFFLALLASPAFAEERCSELGIQTVNWKAPDSEQTGVLVLHVDPGCVAGELGIEAGEVITGFNDSQIANSYDLAQFAGKHPAHEAFSITLKSADGQPRTLRRAATSRPMVNYPEPAPYAETSGEWLTWFKWAGLFLLVSLTVTPIFAWICRDHMGHLALVGAATGVYDEFRQGGRDYVKAGIQGAATVLIGILVIILAGPVGLLYNLYQPLAAMRSEADQKVCCVEDAGKYALSRDGRWLAMVKPTPDRYFGMGDKIARTPYVAALTDLKTGRFVAWNNSTDKRWLGIEPSANSGLREVYFDSLSQRPYAVWNNGFSTRIEPADQPVLPEQDNAPRPVLHYSMTSDADGKFVFSDPHSGKTFALDPGQPYDKWWLSADGRVLALATRPYQPSKQYDGWFKRAYYTVRNFILDDWSVTFWDVGDQRKLAVYKGYGYDLDRWNDGSFLDASIDGRRWVMVRNNGFALAFDLTKKIGPAYASSLPAGPLYRAQNDSSKISFYVEGKPSSALPDTLARLVGRYPSEILEEHPEIVASLKTILGVSYQPLMDKLIVETPAEAALDGGLTYATCKQHACPDGRLVVHVSPNFKISALLFHDEQEISLPEAPRQGEIDPDEWSRLVLYTQAAYPPSMPRALFDAALNDPRALGNPAFVEDHTSVSSRFWIVGKLP